MPNSLVFQATTPHPANLNHPARDEYYVVSNLRGGGEFGTEWHLNGNLTRKQNVFDDFAACARHLIERGYTCPACLAVEGRCNGGLLMGAFLTQHPELASAVVAHVGIYDMLRFEANASANPILVLLSSASGHGMGTALAERIAENADVLAYLFNQLGMTLSAPSCPGKP